MKKLGLLVFTFITLLFIGMHVAPEATAQPGVSPLSVTVIQGEGQINREQQNLNIPGNFGAAVSVDARGLVNSEKSFAYYILNGEKIDTVDIDFTISGSTNLIIVMAEPGEKVASFVDTNGELLYADYVTEGSAVFAGTAPSKPGYQFVAFDASYPAENAVYVAQYTRTAANVSVTIDGVETGYPYNSVVELNAPANFSYWADQDGQVIYRDPEYKFSALADMTINAVTGDSESVVPHVYLSNVTGIRPDHISLLGYIEGDIVEYGILASTEEKVLTRGASGVVDMISQSLSAETNEFLRSIPTSSNFVSFRAYGIRANGDVIYSDNNFAVANYLSHSMDFLNGHGNSYGVAPNYIQTFNYNNLVDTPNIEVTMLRAANNTSNGLSNAIVLSPRQNQGDSEAYAEFNITGGTMVRFDVAYWNTSAIPLFDNLLVQEFDGNVWITIYDVLQQLDDSMEIIEVSTALSGNKFRIYASGGASNSNDARVLIDNLEVYQEINTKLYGVDLRNEDLSVFLSVVKGASINQTISTDRVGKIFDGWFESEDLTGTPFNLNQPINQHILLYASYSNLEEFTVTFNLDGGSGDGDYENKILYQGDRISQPNPSPVKNGFTFAGWFTDPGTWLELWDFNNEIDQDVDLIAYWIEESEIEPETLSLMWSNVSNSGTTSYQNRTWSFNSLVMFNGTQLSRNGSGVEYTIQGNGSNSSRITSVELGILQKISIRMPNTGSSASASAKWYVEVADNGSFTNSTRYNFGSGYNSTTNIDLNQHTSTTTVTVTNVLTLKDTSTNTPSIVINVIGHNATFVRFVWENGAVYIAQIDIEYLPQ